LTYHVVAGKMSSDIAKAIKAGKGKATLNSKWRNLVAMMQGKDLIITDEMVEV
jgi:hypothetical protein